jgi:threonine dehydrogenase-like Zn-dependent dehydrogenase
MPREVVTEDGSRFWFRDYQLPPLGEGEVRVRTEFAAPKHGTEAHLIGGSAFQRKRWDPELRLFLPLEQPPEPSAPVERGIGNMLVGTVTEAGPGTTGCAVGDRVFCYGPIREVHQTRANGCYALGGLTPADAVCVDPAHVAFVAVRDGNVRVGDTVAVYGLGAIGLMAVQIARVGGAAQVFAVDPIALRRRAALAMGADAAFDPAETDAALEIKRATNSSGVDVSIETSGNDRALHDAIRCIRQCGTVVHVPWGPGSAPNLHLDEEFHLNRPTLVGSQAWEGWGCADRSYPLWDHRRAFGATIDLFRRGRISGEHVVEPVVGIEDAPEALGRIFRAPQTTIKVGVTFAVGGGG